MNLDRQDQSFEIVGKTFAGLEPVLEKELHGIGAKQIKLLTRGVSFHGDLGLLYMANYTCRSAIRFLKPILKFRAKNEDELYKGIKRYAWDQIFSINDTFSIDAVVNHSPIKQSKYAALKVKDAIVDQFRQKTGKRPSVDVENPAIRLHLHIHMKDCTVSLDSSGSSLHLRGYRSKTVTAPMNEVLAAGLIMLTGWKGEKNFTDPMCGSGTFLIESAMIAKSIPAGYYRQHYGFQRWREYDKELWNKVKKNAIAEIKPLQIKIQGSDLSDRAIRSSRDNLHNAGLYKEVELRKTGINESVPPPGQGIAIINPPYGERLLTADLLGLYKTIGDSFKRTYKGYEAWIISSDMDAMKNIGLRPSRKITVFNGKLACRFARYELYEGSRKTKKS
jgi:putative N6-adenine-specific DNA methylase